ncbi:MAG: efflux RND transporter permease subunit, partial [Isosphaeraceae bacterium]|nr:efflux RND transporter permease subunit [Isosphaeraceae bacterium]
MSLPALCIKRPVFATMLCTLPIVLGIVSYRRLGVDLQPKLDLPFVFITTTLRGASVEEVETQVTRPIEEAVNTIEGIDELRSITQEGVSKVYIRFVLEKDPDVAAQEVQNKVNAMVAQLPRGVTLPVIDKLDEDAAPVVTVVVSGKRDLREVTEIARRRIKENIETVSGVGQVALVGGRRRTIQVTVDTDKLSQFSLSIEDVRQALASQNLELPGGRVEQGKRELVLRVLGRFDTAERFNDLVVTTEGGYPVRVRDLGHAEESVEDPRNLVRLDGDPAVSLIVRKQTGANTVEVVRLVKERLKTIQKTLPADIQIQTTRDQSIFINRSIEEVQFHLLLAAVLVSATILLFIRDWRTTLIATSAIPASIIATFACMDALGFTINNITMLALVLAIGIVIDDAVVVHENIFRHMEEHRRPAMEAARIGTSEIALAVLATSLSLVVIFVPVAFMEGQVGRLFHSFGLTIAFAILMSLFVSFTLTPMLCSRFLKIEHGSGGGSKSNWLYRAVEDSYAAVLAWSLRHKGIVAVLSLLLILSGYPLLKMTHLEYIPPDDTSEFEVSLTAPPGTTLEAMDRQFQEIEHRLKKLPGVVSVLTTIGDTSGRITKGSGDVTRGSLYVKLVDLNERDFSQFDVMKQARQMLRDYPDDRISVSNIDPLRGSGYSFQVDLNLVGPDLDVLSDYTYKLIDRLKRVPGLADVDTTLSVRKPELQVVLDRDRAADLGVNAEQVASSLGVLVGGEPVSTFKDGDEQYDVWLRAEPRQRTDREAIDDLTMRAASGQLVPLGSLARLEESRGPSQIERLNRMRRTTVGANLEGISTGEAVEAMAREVEALGLPPGYGWRKGYRSRSLDDVASNFLLAFALSLVFMYMVLAAQFESFTDPITILMALPLTFPFALISLQMLGQSMDIYAIFGLFMLVGIVKKNGILQVDYTNELRRRGLPRDEAILEANRTRLRPILMTTLMLVAGMIPIALGRGPGAAARASLANVIIGGQMLSLLPTLLITPISYALMD